MRPSNHPGHIIPQDTGPKDAGDDVITGLPISQDEIDELTFGEDRPLEERIDRLRELANDIRVRAAGEVADDDAKTLLASIERAITSLESRADYPGEPGALEEDPLDHRETLAPDSDELEEIEEEDEESIEDDIGEIGDDDDNDDDDDDDEDDEEEEEVEDDD